MITDTMYFYLHLKLNKIFDQSSILESRNSERSDYSKKCQATDTPTSVIYREQRYLQSL